MFKLTAVNASLIKGSPACTNLHRKAPRDQANSLRGFLKPMLGLWRTEAVGTPASICDMRLNRIGPLFKKSAIFKHSLCTGMVLATCCVFSVNLHNNPISQIRKLRTFPKQYFLCPQERKLRTKAVKLHSRKLLVLEHGGRGGVWY